MLASNTGSASPDEVLKSICLPSIVTYEAYWRNFGCFKSSLIKSLRTLTKAIITTTWSLVLKPVPNFYRKLFQTQNARWGEGGGGTYLHKNLVPVQISKPCLDQTLIPYFRPDQGNGLLTRPLYTPNTPNSRPEETNQTIPKRLKK